MGVRSKEMFVFADHESGGIIHVANIKGGVGKTTVATNLGASLSRRGKTLIIDLDVQGSATIALGRELAGSGHSSWELFRTRLLDPDHGGHQLDAHAGKMRILLAKIEKSLSKRIIGATELSELVTPVHSNLDLIAANAELFKNPSVFQLNNLLYNLRAAKSAYKYIIVDTPSVWNRLTRYLYRNVDLNLIPVTLNALSTKSLREYLSNVRSLVQHHPSVRIRVIKNEVYGKQDSKIKGKIRTMNENRRFLDSLCEQTLFKTKHGYSSLPQSIILDLEIPESASILDAQDEGKLICDYQQYSAVARAFEELGKRVQYVLNMPVYKTTSIFTKLFEMPWVPRFAAVAVLFIFFYINTPLSDLMAPRPVAPQELVIPNGGVFSHKFTQGESLGKASKFAISWFRATVPSPSEINDYILEVVSIHNLTRGTSQPRITTADNIKPGTIVNFFPPSKIVNPEEKELIPVYRYFMKIVNDAFSYVTGDWCERGSGGGQPHYGMDIAAAPGSNIISPVAGTITLKTDDVAGRVVGVEQENAIIYFCHMDQRFVKAGDTVHEGTVLGTVGNTGRSTGPHVHVGYAVRSQSRTDIAFGQNRYMVTDPKLFYYRKMYIDNIASK
jgi:cellulose biosynthesis protein BcsQ